MQDDESDASVSGEFPMSRKKISNVAHSVRDRLLKLSRESGRDFNYVLQRYAYERLYFRLGRSEYAARFVLKGASLFAVWLGPMFRVTQDTDFECNLTADHDCIRNAFFRIAQTEVDDDGIVFDCTGIASEDIKKEDKYKGIRVKMTAFLGAARIPLQIDVGFGDSIYPAPAYSGYPTLLPGEEPRLKIYPQYTVIAEKVSAMVELGMRNSRLKDYFDLWVMLGKFTFDYALARTAIVRTFARRGLELPKPWPIGLTEEFSGDAMKRAQWTAFLRKVEPQEKPESLGAAIERVREFLDSIVRGVETAGNGMVWKPGSGWCEEREGR